MARGWVGKIEGSKFSQKKKQKKTNNRKQNKKYRINMNLAKIPEANNFYNSSQFSLITAHIYHMTREIILWNTTFF